MKNFVKWNELKNKILKDPSIKIEYDLLEPEFRLIRQILTKRLQKGISQKQLAKKVKTKQSAISRLESGNYNPSLKFLNKVAEALDSKLVVKLT